MSSIAQSDSSVTTEGLRRRYLQRWQERLEEIERALIAAEREEAERLEANRVQFMQQLQTFIPAEVLAGWDVAWSGGEGATLAATFWPVSIWVWLDWTENCRERVLRLHCTSDGCCRGKRYSSHTATLQHGLASDAVERILATVVIGALKSAGMGVPA